MEGQPDTAEKANDLVVFDLLKPSQCAECFRELLQGDFLFMENRLPLCLNCADLDHLVYLPRGDTALTRRARKHSSLSAVVVHFSRARRRYERQGVLVEEEALARAEKDCHADAAERQSKRERDALQRVRQDQEFTKRMSESILLLFPGCPAEEARAIAAHASVRGSGRVGRTAGGKSLETEALTAAVIAAIRHRHTPYDKLLMKGYDRTEARHAVRGQTHRVLEHWRNRPLRDF
jgi:hypothetical protein